MQATTEEAVVRRSVTVKATQEQAFRVFTHEFDSWWPRTHHIGKSPMKRAIIESSTGGRCYSEQEDGTDCEWGTVLVWEPPHRFVLAWQINEMWGYEPSIEKSSEVEVRFTPEADGSTRVDLEHRHFDRHGAAGGTIRKAVSSEGGWGTLLQMFAARANAAAAS